MRRDQKDARTQGRKDARTQKKGAAVEIAICSTRTSTEDGPISLIETFQADPGVPFLLLELLLQERREQFSLLHLQLGSRFCLHLRSEHHMQVRRLKWETAGVEIGR
jgi:hypothetical protein